MKQENKRQKFLIILFFILACIVAALVIGMTINIKEGNIDISKFINKWIENPEASTTNRIEENVKDIDLTKIITGEDLRHTHIYEKRYDSNYHWEQCWMCNEVINKVSHNLAVRGIDSCRWAAGYQTKYCVDGCGYSEQLPKKEHIPNGTWITFIAGSVHYQYCTVCGDWLTSQYCTDSNGQQIRCNSGTCTICGHTYSGNLHGRILNGSCNRCGVKLIEHTSSKEIIDENTTRVHYELTPLNGVGIDINDAKVTTWTNVLSGEWKITLENKYKIGNTYHIIGLYTSCNAASSQVITDGAYFPSYTINGVGQEGEIVVNGINISPDNYAPTKSSISGVGSGSLGNFGTKATVTATFTDGGIPDNNVVYMRLVDKDKNTVISDWGAANQNGTTYTRTFEVTAEIREVANVYVQAKDATRKYYRNR